MSVCADSHPKVSVFMTTYYHEKYLRQAVESVIAQKVDFPFEIVISDDASKDGTPELIKQLAAEYPCIRYVINAENKGLTANVYQVKSMCRGDYLIDLSGDDYWIDPEKMRKQASFLDDHTDYIAVGTRIESRINDSQKAEEVIPDLKYCNCDITLDMFLSGISIPLNGIMMRNVYKDDSTKDLFAIMPKMSRYIDDLTDEFLLHLSGRIMILPDITSVYRMIKDVADAHNYNSLERNMDRFQNHVELLNNLDQYFEAKYDFFDRYRMTTRMAILHAVQSGNFSGFKNVYATIPSHYRRRGLLIRSGLSSGAYVLKVLGGRLTGRRRT